MAQGSVSFQDEFAPIWQSSKKLTIELAQAMPDSLYSFKPTPEMKSFAEQMVHIAYSSQWMYEFIIPGKTEDLIVSPDAGIMTKEEVLGYRETAFEKGAANIGNHDPDDLNRKILYFGQGEFTVKWAFISIMDHVTNHRAKANLYFRLNGLVPLEYNYLTTAD